MINTYFIKLNNAITYQKIHHLLHLVTPERQYKINRLYFENDKKLSLYSELLIRQIVCHNYNLKNDKVNFEYNKFGKPHLLNIPNFHFNISHTQCALIVATHSSSIGIDIEELSSIDSNIEADLVKRFFCIDERNYIFKSSASMDKRFWEVWTKKEAYLKFLGTGLNIPLNSFSIFSTNISSKMHTVQKDNFVISLCTCKSVPNITINTITEDNLIKSLW